MQWTPLPRPHSSGISLGISREMGRRLHCSWCERADAYGAVSWVSLGDNAGDKAVGKVLRVVEIVHL